MDKLSQAENKLSGLCLNCGEGPPGENNGLWNDEGIKQAAKTLCHDCFNVILLEKLREMAKRHGEEYG